MKPTLNSAVGNPEKRATTFRRGAYTRAEMKAIEQEFINHEGSYLTLQQAMELAKAQADQQSTHEKSA